MAKRKDTDVEGKAGTKGFSDGNQFNMQITNVLKNIKRCITRFYTNRYNNEYTVV